MEFNITVLIALSALMLLCVCLVFNGYPAAEIGVLFFAGLMSPESGFLQEWPLRLPKTAALDLRRPPERSAPQASDQRPVATIRKPDARPVMRSDPRPARRAGALIASL